MAANLNTRTEPSSTPHTVASFAGSSFGRAAAAIDAAASSDETASERDYDDDPQDFYVDDHMYGAGFDPHADQGGAGAKYKLLGSGNAADQQVKCECRVQFGSFLCSHAHTLQLYTHKLPGVRQGLPRRIY
jgi:hypothetical protein